MNEEKEAIIKLGSEGGTVTLWRRTNSSGQREYAMSRNESVMADLLSEEDSDLLPLLVSEPKNWGTSFDDAVRSLERYNWVKLRPLHVHPDFQFMIWDMVVAQKPGSSDLYRWAEACGLESIPRVTTLADWISKSRSTVVLTGAGVSTGSGVPDFRSEAGWWKNIDPTTVATAHALQHNYHTFHAFYSFRVKALADLLPNESHRILAKWDELGLVEAVATQNVDGFHQMAGSQNVYELHGSIRSARCSKCGRAESIQAFVDRSPCQKCGGNLRPNVVLFDESLPAQAWEEAMRVISASELVIAIGTSLNVYPAHRLPSMTKGRTAVINLEPTGMDDAFDLIIHGRSEDILRQVDRWIGGHGPCGT